jgi:hypothetical protein
MAKLTTREREALKLLHEPLPLGTLPCVECGESRPTALRDLGLGQAFRLCEDCGADWPRLGDGSRA